MYNRLYKSRKLLEKLLLYSWRLMILNGLYNLWDFFGFIKNLVWAYAHCINEQDYNNNQISKNKWINMNNQKLGSSAPTTHFTLQPFKPVSVGKRGKKHKRNQQFSSTSYNSTGLEWMENLQILWCFSHLKFQLV